MWIYSAGHAGFRGNERDDRLHSASSAVGTMMMETREIVKKIYKRMLVDDTGISRGKKE